jgi:hypothetical protein
MANFPDEKFKTFLRELAEKRRAGGEAPWKDANENEAFAKLNAAIEGALKHLKGPTTTNHLIAEGIPGIEDGQRLIILRNTLTGSEIVRLNKRPREGLEGNGELVWIKENGGERKFAKDFNSRDEFHSAATKLCDVIPSMAEADTRLHHNRKSNEPMRSDEETKRVDRSERATELPHKQPRERLEK